MAVQLLERDPAWWVSHYIAENGLRTPPSKPPERHGMGICFDCPVHGAGCPFGRVSVPFQNPLDGLPRAEKGGGANRDVYWQRSGETFQDLTLSPSIDWKEEGRESHWHGHLQGGVLTP